MITKQSIHEEFEKSHKYIFAEKDPTYGEENRRNKIIVQSFYDTQIQKLLEEIVQEEKEVPKGQDWGHTYNQGKIDGFNKAIQEIKAKIQERGY